jgi:hypothetical protein
MYLTGMINLGVSKELMTWWKKHKDEAVTFHTRSKGAGASFIKVSSTSNITFTAAT